jgi:predicted enzyme related to lactoylglutathione lyase
MKAPVGSFGWADLSVENASEIRDFYSSVVGYTFSGIDMGGYDDFCMNSPDDGLTKAGICHAKGENKNLPSMWLIYFYVADLNASLEKLKEKGGEIISGPKSYGNGSFYAVIKDPAGACCALFEQADED